MSGILDPKRRALLDDLERLWLRTSDLRFGQMLRVAAAGPVDHPAELTCDGLSAGVALALGKVQERPVPEGPYWDTATKGAGNFLTGRPRDPARIPQLILAFAVAWATRGDLEFGPLIEYALDRARIMENEFGTRWLLVEDVAMTHALEAVTAG